jgi:tetratricopeptide (TPR) repeat protein
MHSAAGSESEQRIPRLSPQWETVGQQLSPAEGFLLSRIDGHTPWEQLRQIAGIPPQEVDRYLERWLSEGIVEMSDGALARSSADEVDEPSGLQPDPRIDPDLGIDSDLQQRILEFEASLDRSYFDLLGVDRNASSKEIKRAYFSLSKVFHPDRYFRKELGHYVSRLESIFRKLVEAYELLSDPITRAEVERSLGAMPVPQPQPESEALEPEPVCHRPSAPRKLSKRETLDRLRGHFKIPKAILAERSQKARHFYDLAMAASEQERWIEAAPNLRLAIAFDPWNTEFPKHFADVLSHYHEQRALEMIDAGNAAGASEDRLEALRLLEEALIHRPADAEMNERAAKITLALGDLERALEYAEAACEYDPDTARRWLTLARVLRRSGSRDKAIDTLKKAARLDSKDNEIQVELEDMRRKSRPKT